ncbi:hypothetical protein [Kitasatospora sp. NPDC001132]
MSGPALYPGTLLLWTSTGWTRQRPIYAVAAHRSVEVALDDRVPLRQPGGDTEQFAGLLGLLKVQQLDKASAEAVEPGTAMPDSVGSAAASSEQECGTARQSWACRAHGLGVGDHQGSSDRLARSRTRRRRISWVRWSRTSRRHRLK